ncbi:HlyD family efflux transporter periplasmic adaptor subunit [Devosia sp. J2-20]|uniref:HlyD family secretion protein n=1 Tax=Devosia sp. J2-20 TaxID=3026161 RepID=UPI00249B0516|nr:HlyD family efflux transporter periplasmic adaptor subunit [Devosia sp. J2-20]WDR00871.1 HlyD family efflux transporter periplasmic adaptor subunit [Devosia sp. J2-20]
MNEFFAGILATLMAILPGGATVDTGYVGYLEADYVYLAPASGGRIAEISVHEGEAVAVGQLLFSLDDRQQQALLDAAQARVASAEATLDNLVTGGRSQEIDVIRATLSKAQSDLVLAQSNLARSEKLLALGTVPEVRVEQDRAALNAAQAQVNQLTAQVGVAELPARNAQQLAAEANLNAAQADARRAALELADRQTRAPVAGLVDRLFYTTGEMATGAPVLSILPAGALKARFFVPETDRSGLALGDQVAVGCDGCSAMRATISYLAQEPQTTPPVIYSREERGRLVYLVEAELAEPGTLQPGQPVTVTR